MPRHTVHPVRRRHVARTKPLGLPTYTERRTFSNGGETVSIPVTYSLSEGGTFSNGGETVHMPGLRR